MTTERLAGRAAAWVRRSVIVVAVTVGIGVVPIASAPAGITPDAPIVTTAVAGPAVGAVIVGWSLPSRNGSPITTYKFSRSIDGGATWSAVKSFGSAVRQQSTANFPSFVCTNTSPGSKGCLFRIYATSALGTSPPSKPVALWTVSDPPLGLFASRVDSTLTNVFLFWRRPANTGGLNVTGYEVLASMNRGTKQVVATPTALTTTVPCTGSISCAYTVRALTSQGTSGESRAAVVAVAPARVADAVIQNAGNNLGTALTTLTVSWSPPLGGLPADHYQVEWCAIRVGAVDLCGATSTLWKSRTNVTPASGRTSAQATCKAGYATCVARVRGVNARGGAGSWRSLDLEPWAPFGVSIKPGAAHGSVVVKFSGPAESGPGPVLSKHYRVLVCEANCGTDTSWSTASDAVPYPPTGKAPFTAGTFSCAAPAPTASSQAATPGVSSSSHPCRVRMQFFDGFGAGGILSRAAAGFQRP